MSAAERAILDYFYPTGSSSLTQHRDVRILWLSLPVCLALAQKVLPPIPAPDAVSLPNQPPPLRADRDSDDSPMRHSEAAAQGGASAISETSATAPTSIYAGCELMMKKALIQHTPVAMQELRAAFPTPVSSCPYYVADSTVQLVLTDQPEPHPWDKLDSYRQVHGVVFVFDAAAREYTSMAISTVSPPHPPATHSLDDKVDSALDSLLRIVLGVFSSYFSDQICRCVVLNASSVQRQVVEALVPLVPSPAVLVAPPAYTPLSRIAQQLALDMSLLIVNRMVVQLTHLQQRRDQPYVDGATAQLVSTPLDKRTSVVSASYTSSLMSLSFFASSARDDAANVGNSSSNTHSKTSNSDISKHNTHMSTDRADRISMSGRQGTKLKSRLLKRCGDIYVQLGAYTEAMRCYGETHFASNTDNLWCSSVVECVAAVLFCGHLRTMLDRLPEVEDTLMLLQSGAAEWGGSANSSDAAIGGGRGSSTSLTARINTLEGLVVARFAARMMLILPLLRDKSMPQSMHQRMHKEVEKRLGETVTTLRRLSHQARVCVTVGSTELVNNPRADYTGVDLRLAVQEAIELGCRAVEILLHESLRQLRKLNYNRRSSGSSSAIAASHAGLLMQRGRDVRMTLFTLAAEKGSHRSFMHEMVMVQYTLNATYGSVAGQVIQTQSTQPSLQEHHHYQQQQVAVYPQQSSPQYHLPPPPAPPPQQQHRRRFVLFCCAYLVMRCQGRRVAVAMLVQLARQERVANRTGKAWRTLLCACALAGVAMGRLLPPLASHSDLLSLHAEDEEDFMLQLLLARGLATPPEEHQRDRFRRRADVANPTGNNYDKTKDGSAQLLSSHPPTSVAPSSSSSLSMSDADEEDTSKQCGDAHPSRARTWDGHFRQTSDTEPMTSDSESWSKYDDTDEDANGRTHVPGHSPVRAQKGIVSTNTTTTTNRAAIEEEEGGNGSKTTTVPAHAGHESSCDKECDGPTAPSGTACDGIALSMHVSLLRMMVQLLEQQHAQRQQQTKRMQPWMWWGCYRDSHSKEDTATLLARVVGFLLLRYHTFLTATMQRRLRAVWHTRSHDMSTYTNRSNSSTREGHGALGLPGHRRSLAQSNPTNHTSAMASSSALPLAASSPVSSWLDRAPVFTVHHTGAFVRHAEAMPLPSHLAPAVVPVGGPVFTFIDTARLKLTVLSLHGRRLRSRVVWVAGDGACVALTLYNPLVDAVRVHAMTLICDTCPGHNDRCHRCYGTSQSTRGRCTERNHHHHSAQTCLGTSSQQSQARSWHGSATRAAHAVAQSVVYPLYDLVIAGRAAASVKLALRPGSAGWVCVRGVQLVLADGLPTLRALWPTPMSVPVLPALPRVVCTLRTREVELFAQQRVSVEVLVSNVGAVSARQLRVTAHSETCRLEDCEGCWEGAEGGSDNAMRVHIDRTALAGLEPVVLRPQKLSSAQEAEQQSAQVPSQAQPQQSVEAKHVHVDAAMHGSSGTTTIPTATNTDPNLHRHQCRAHGRNSDDGGDASRCTETRSPGCLPPGATVPLRVTLIAPTLIDRAERHFVVFRVHCALPHRPPRAPPHTPPAVPVFGVIPRRVWECPLRVFYAPAITVSPPTLTSDGRSVHMDVMNRSPHYVMTLHLSRMPGWGLSDAVLLAHTRYAMPPIPLRTIVNYFKGAEKDGEMKEDVWHYVAPVSMLGAATELSVVLDFTSLAQAIKVSSSSSSSSLACAQTHAASTSARTHDAVTSDATRDEVAVLERCVVTVRVETLHDGLLRWQGESRRGDSLRRTVRQRRHRRRPPCDPCRSPRSEKERSNSRDDGNGWSSSHRGNRVSRVCSSCCVNADSAAVSVKPVLCRVSLGTKARVSDGCEGAKRADKDETSSTMSSTSTTTSEASMRFVPVVDEVAVLRSSHLENSSTSMTDQEGNMHELANREVGRVRIPVHTPVKVQVTVSSPSTRAQRLRVCVSCSGVYGSAATADILSGLLDTTVSVGGGGVDDGVKDAMGDESGQWAMPPCSGYCQCFEYIALTVGEKVLVVKLMDSDGCEMIHKLRLNVSDGTLQGAS